jgi:purine-binding chemotaxis protein CheW
VEKIASTSPTPVVSTTADDGAVVLGVRLGEEDYGINISKVREIMKRSTITPVPRQPAYVEGVMNVRGTIIPVVNLRKRFDLKGEPTANQHTVIVDSSEGMVGILVDSVSQVIRLPLDHIHPAPPIASGVEGEYLRGICRVGDRLLLYLDVEKILRKATPVSMLQHRGQLGMQGRVGRLALSSDEQKVIKAIPITGIIKSGLKKRTKFSDTRLTRTISSLKRRGLVKKTKDGNKRVISRTSSTAHAN